MIGRRHMLGALALGGGATMLPLPLFAANRGQARIAKIEAFAVSRAVFVKVTADDGSAGWGEAGHSGAKFVAKLINDDMAKYVTGDDVFAGEATWAKLHYEYDEMGPGGIASQAIAGIDCALWIARALAEQARVGAARRQVPRRFSCLWLVQAATWATANI